MNKSTTTQGFQPVRHDRLLQEQFHDTYRSRGKLAEPTVCDDCGAVFMHGHWQWGDAPKDAQHTTCPACHRQRDNFPAGFVSLGGEFFAAHRDEILNVVRNEEDRERREHALQRIMGTAGEDDGITVTTTDIHLARRLGEAVHRAYGGELEFHYNAEQNLLRVRWNR